MCEGVCCLTQLRSQCSESLWCFDSPTSLGGQHQLATALECRYQKLLVWNLPEWCAPHVPSTPTPFPSGDVLWVQEHTFQKGNAQRSALKPLILPRLALTSITAPWLLLLHLWLPGDLQPMSLLQGSVSVLPRFSPGVALLKYFQDIGNIRRFLDYQKIFITPHIS